VVRWEGLLYKSRPFLIEDPAEFTAIFIPTKAAASTSAGTIKGGLLEAARRRKHGHSHRLEAVFEACRVLNSSGRGLRFGSQ